MHSECSEGTSADRFDNALAETWVDWSKHRRLHEFCGDPRSVKPDSTTTLKKQTA